MLRFSIREWFLLTAIVALALGWGISNAYLKSRMRATRRHAEVLRAALYNAGHNHHAQIHGMLNNPSFPTSLKTVDWDLCTQPIP